MKKEFLEIIETSKSGIKVSSNEIKGAWFHALKYSYSQAEEVDGLNSKMQMRKLKSVQLIKDVGNLYNDGDTPGEIVGKLSPETLDQLVEANRDTDSTEMIQTVLRYGLGVNNFTDTTPPSDEDIDAIMTHAKFAREILAEINRVNRPLAKKKAE